MVGFPVELRPLSPLAYPSPERRAAYTKPDSLLRPESEWGTPPAPYHDPKEEAVALALRLDFVGRLAILSCRRPWSTATGRILQLLLPSQARHGALGVTPNN